MANAKIGWAAGLAAMVLGAQPLRAAGESPEPTFPYVAYIASADAAVRSGPGVQYYATDRVTSGYAVEVYRHDGDRWCAIRPPAGSFSLASTRRLRLIDQRTAQVTDGGVPARVGARTAQRQPIVQVLLEKGEIVELLETPAPASPDAKIAPPTGEFRWIDAAALARSAPVEGAAPIDLAATSDGADSTSPFDHLLSGAAVNAAQPIPADFADSRAAPTPVDGGLQQTAGVDEQLQQAVVLPGSPAAVKLASGDADRYGADALLPPPLASVAGAADTSSDVTATSPVVDELSASKSGIPRIRFEGVPKAGPLDPRVAELHLRLSKVVAGPMNGWQFAAFRDETAALLAKEATPEVRDQLRELLDRVGQFESIQTRSAALAAGRPIPGLALAGTGNSTRGLDGKPDFTGDTSEIRSRIARDLAGSDASAVAATAPSKALYDAVGTLKPVVSRRPSAPRYALVDDRGEVVSLVSPQGSVDLQPYVGKRIGVNGSRGFMPELRRSHVTATRVTPLDGETMVR